MGTAFLLTPEADVVPIALPASTKERAVVYRAVIRCRCYDVVALTTRLDMWVDDEGIYNHPVNPGATALARRYGYTWQLYHGPVLLTGGADENGDTRPLTTDQVRALLTGLLDLT